MAGKGIAAQRDEVILVELTSIKASIAELKVSVGGIGDDLDKVRISELAAIRDKIAALDATVQVLQYQAKRSGAFAGAWISAVISVLVAAGAALLLKHQ